MMTTGEYIYKHIRNQPYKGAYGHPSMIYLYANRYIYNPFLYILRFNSETLLTL